MEHLNHLLVSMKPWLEQYGYLAIIVSVFLEGIGIPLPGQSLVIAAALLSSEQIMNLGSVALVAWLSCFFGNTCAWNNYFPFVGSRLSFCLFIPHSLVHWLERMETLAEHSFCT